MARKIFANIGRHKPARQRTAFRKILRHVARLNAVIGWAEIGEADGRTPEPRLLRRWFRSSLRWKTRGMPTKHPVTFHRFVWKLQSFEKFLAVHGVRRAWPHRYVNVARLRHRWSGRLESHVNTHFVPGAWNGRREAHEQDRVRGWHTQWEILRNVVAAEHQEGRHVTVTGDFNRQGKFPELHPDAVLVHEKATDRIYVIPAPGYRVSVHSRGHQALGIDFHDALWANVKFHKQ